MLNNNTLEKVIQSHNIRGGALGGEPGEPLAVVPGGAHGEGPAQADEYRGLSNTNKVQTVIMQDMKSGEVIELEKGKLRLGRLRRRVFAWAETVKEYLPAKGIGLAHRKVMITLTYEGVDDWRPNHIRDYIKELRRRLQEKIIAYAWVAELQERGAVHYHVELIVKKGTRIPMPDKSGMWKHGMSRIETARTIFYICTYLKKQYQKEGRFPKGMRMFSVWIQPGLFSGSSRWRFRLSVLPAWLHDKVLEDETLLGAKWSRNPGGGWRFPGRFFRSPFRFLGFGWS